MTDDRIRHALTIVDGEIRAVCGACWIEGVYRRRGRAPAESQRDDAARQFERLGWRFSGGLRCPRCVMQGDANG